MTPIRYDRETKALGEKIVYVKMGGGFVSAGTRWVQWNSMENRGERRSLVGG